MPAGKTILIEVKCGAKIVAALVRSLDATELEPAQLRVIAIFVLVALATRVAFGRLLRIPTGAILLAWIGLVLIFCSLPH